MGSEIVTIKKIQTLETSYIVFGRMTRMPFIMGNEESYNDQIRIFENKDEAISFCSELQDKTKDILMVAEIHNAQMLHFYGGLFLIDVDEVVFKADGEEEVILPLEKIVIKPDFSKHPAVNSNLQLSGLYFMQELAKNLPNDEKKKLPMLEEEMAANVSRGKFIVPVFVNAEEEENKDSKIMLPRIANKEGKQFQPLFTDINEYMKFSKDSKYKLNVMDFDKVLHILDDSVEGAVINPLGMNITLSKKTLGIIKMRFDNVE